MNISSFLISYFLFFNNFFTIDCCITFLTITIDSYLQIRRVGKQVIISPVTPKSNLPTNKFLFSVSTPIGTVNFLLRIVGGGRVVRWCWVNFQCRGVLLIWIIVGQGPTVLAVGAGGGCLDIFSLAYHFSFLSPSLWETARYRLKYCLKGPLSPKQPTNIKDSPSVFPFSFRRVNISFQYFFNHINGCVFVVKCCFIASK